MRKSFFRRPQFVVAMALVLLFFACDFGVGFVLLDSIPNSPNKYYHHALKPNLSIEAHWTSYRYPMATDSLGLRDDKPRKVPAVGTHRRLLFLGDSFTEGLGVPYNQTFVGIIADRIRRAGDDLEVLNGGVASHSPRLYLLHLQDLIERQGAKFDEIVVFIDVSDILDEITYEDFMPGRITLILAMRYVHQFIVQHSLLADALYRRLPALQVYIGAIRSWMRERLERKASPAPALLVTPAAAEATKPVPQGPADVTPPAREVWDNSNYYEIRETWVDNDEAFRAWGAYGLKLARNNLTRLADYAASKGMTISFAIYPWPRFAQQPHNRGQLAWTKIASDEKWTLVDLYPDFAALPDPARLYFPGDVHWNADGHQFVAEIWLSHYCELRHATWCDRLRQTATKKSEPP